MALIFNVNQTPANWVGCMMQLWQTMVSAGWLVLSWSDGAVGGGSTHGSPGAGFLGFSTSSIGIPNSTAGQLGSANNGDAWILLQQPAPSGSIGAPYGGTRQITFQLSNTATRTTWRIKYSLSGGYYPSPASTGSVTATPAINATINDEVLLMGGGTDTVPTFGAMFSNNGTWEGLVRCHCLADNGLGPTGSQPSAPYGWAMWGPNQGIGTTGMTVATAGMINFGFMFDPMQQSTAAPNDLDPFIFYNDTSGFVFQTNQGSSPSWTQQFDNQNCPRSWMRKGQTNQAFTTHIALVPYSANATYLISSVGTNAVTGADDPIPVIYARASANGGLSGYKGISALVRWNGTYRQTSDTLSFSQPGFSRDRIVVAQVNFPWDGSTVPVI